jgi:uncharacterized protein YbjT (DUF2867 family)
MKKILILGGTGFVGRALCQYLTHRMDVGFGALTVPTRHWCHGQSIQMLPTVRLVQTNVYDDASLHELVRGHDAVVNLIARLHGTSAQFEAAHVALPRRLASACQQTGVKRLLHVSSLGAHIDAPSHYLRTKAAGEAVLLGSGLDLTLLAPSVIFGEQDQFINRFASLQALFPVMPLAGHRARFQPVWVNDVASAIVQALIRPGAVGCTFECVGPQIYDLAHLVRLAGQWSAHPRPILPLPKMLAYGQAWIMEHLPGVPIMSRDNLDSLRVDNVHVDGMPGLLELGIVPTAMEAVMPQVLARRSRLDTWRFESGRGST